MNTFPINYIKRLFLGLSRFIAKTHHSFAGWKDAIKGDFREFNKSERFYLYGQTLFPIVLAILYIALPMIVQAITGDVALMGFVRSVYTFTMAGCFLFAGEIIQRSNMQRVLNISISARCIIYVLIGSLFFLHALTFNILLVLVGMSGIVITFELLLNIDTAGANKIFSSAQKKEKAFYLCQLIENTSFLILPLLIGPIIDLIDFYFGLGYGAAVCFLSFAVILMAMRWIYLYKIIPIEDSTDSKAFNTFKEKLSLKFAAAVGICVHTPKRQWLTMKVMWANKSILQRTLMAALENFLSDALYTVILPAYALNILMAGATGTGFLLSGSSFGGLLAASALLKYSRKLQKRWGFYRFIFFLGCLSILTFIPSIVLWAYPSIWLAVPAVVLMEAFATPLTYRMHTMLQIEINNDARAKEHEEDIYSILNQIESIVSITGLLAVTWLFQHSAPGTAMHNLFGENAVMKIVSLFLFGTSFITWLCLFWIKSQAIRVFKSPPGIEDKSYELLEANLKKMQLPNYRSENVGWEIVSDMPSVAILNYPTLDQLAIVKEGGRQSSGNIHLAFDSSWFIQENQPDQSKRLLLKKGFCFDDDGTPLIVEYSPPRHVNYFANFRDDGSPLEERLNTAMSRSIPLGRMSNQTWHQSPLKPPPLYFKINQNDESKRYCYQDSNRLPLHLLTVEEIPSAKPEEKIDWYFRLHVSRTPWNGALTSNIIIQGRSYKAELNEQSNKDKTSFLWIQYEDAIQALRQQHHLLQTEEEVWKFRYELEMMGVFAFYKQVEEEFKHPPKPGDPFQKQTDYINLIVKAELKDGQLTPEVIRFGTHIASGQYALDEFYPEELGEASKFWVATMLARSSRSALKERRLLLVGAGAAENKIYFEKASKWGIETVLLDQPDSWAKSLVSEFIPFDITKTNQTLDFAQIKHLQSMHKLRDIDGITTFCKENTLFTAILARILDLPYHSIETIRHSNDNIKLLKNMKNEGLHGFVFHILRSERDLECAISHLNRLHFETATSPFPMLLKPTNANYSSLETLVHDIAEIRLAFQNTVDKLKTLNSEHFPELILEEFLGGSFWDVDIVMQKGRVLYSALTPKEIQPLPFTSTTHSDDSAPLIQDEQSSIELSILALHALGFTDGVLHINGQYSLKTKRPYILKITACPAGTYTLPWNLVEWGVDLIEMLYTTAMNIPIVLHKPQVPLSKLEDEIILPTRSV